MGENAGVAKIGRTFSLICIGALVWFSALATTGAGAAPSEVCPPLSPAPATSTPSNASPTQSAPSPTGQIVACVGSQSIAQPLFDHWEHVGDLAEAPRRKPQPNTHSVLEEAMGFLISSYWVIGEAQDLHVQVSDAQVRHRFDRIRREQFPKRSEFKAFLRSSGQTVADLLFRVKLNLLSEGIQRRVEVGHHGSGRNQALEHFVREFKSRWLAQTYCLPAYAVSDCGHVQTPL
jgi:hypothetical protein